ncbi:MAG TPA: DUF262 domain-containing protein [Rickettsiales bacterium]|nr:DUF262 domain-containing protein [Rickettsiales bacterium]
MAINRMTFSAGPKLIPTILNDISNVSRGGLDLQPDYQRDFIWNKNFKDNLIHSIIKNYPIGTILIRELDGIPSIKGALQEVVDGQQRLRTICEFFENNYTVNGDVAVQIVEYIKSYLGDDYKDEKIFNKFNNKTVSFKFKDLPSVIQENMNKYQLAIISVSHANEQQITEYFNFVQNQEALRAAEIINSIPDSKLKKYLLNKDETEELMKILNFPDKRQEFQKIFYNIIGIFDKKLSLGTTNKEIIKYASNKKDDLQLESKTYINNLTKNLRFILNIKNKSFETNKRFIKFMLLLCGFNLLDFENNSMNILERLEKINKAIRIFASVKNDVVDEEFKDFNDEEKKHYKYIENITRGSQSYEAVYKACQILAHKIQNDKKIIEINKKQTTRI